MIGLDTNVLVRYAHRLTSSPPLAFGHRLRGKDGESYGATHA